MQLALWFVTGQWRRKELVTCADLDLCSSRGWGSWREMIVCAENIIMVCYMVGSWSEILICVLVCVLKLEL